jgi:SagB-type dehydrogenase family enzyme
LENETALIAGVYRYHDGTKHHFHRMAQSLGYLDWASQPHPFRAYEGARSFPLHPAPSAFDHLYPGRPISYDRLFEPGAPAGPLGAAAIGDLLRHALGLSAWKAIHRSRWSLRVNPSSGNLHPTEAYVVCDAVGGLAGTPAVYHYAADRHVLELRCVFAGQAWTSAWPGRSDILLVALTSVHWRESWKYGERAFRYCQHDLGHAVAAIGGAAALVGRRAVLLPAWSHGSIAALTGVDRDEDFAEAEREEPGCVLAIVSAELAGPPADRGLLEQDGSDLASVVRRGRWTGRASQLSEDHVEWTFIDEVARATAAPAPVVSPCPTCVLLDPSERTEPLAPSTRARSSCSGGARSRSTAAQRFSGPSSSTCCRESCPIDIRSGTSCGGDRGFTSRCSCTASTASRRACIC